MIYDQFNRPIKPSQKAPFADLPLAPMLDSYRDYVTASITPERMAAIFRKADSGDISQQCELFEQIEEKDAHIIGERGKRVNAISDVQFSLQPMSEDAQDIKIYEFLQDWYDGFQQWNDTAVSMQDAVGKCFTGHWINWDTNLGLPEKLTFVEQKRFLFYDETGYLLNYPRLTTDDNPNGIDIKPWELMFHRYNGQTGHPSRSGIYRVCAWMWLFKSYSIKDWVAFCETYGMPLRLGKYNPGQSGERDVLLEALRQLGSDGAGVVPKGTEIEFESGISANASGDLYQNLAKFANREMSKAITGSSQSGDSETQGSFASDQTKNGIRLDLVKSDANAIASTFRNQILRPIVLFNFPPGAKVPKFNAIFEEKEDLKAKAETFSILSQMGGEISKKQFNEEFGLKEPESEDDFLRPPQPQPEQPEKPIENKDDEEQKETKLNVPRGTIAKNNPKKKAAKDRLADEIDPFMTAAIDNIRSYIMKAKSLEEIRDGVFNLFPNMKSSDIGKIMTEAMIVGELTGRDEG